ncbi:MAG: hypothetical protein R3B70_29965 [Polyangiaceae bacterium]
MAKPAKPSAADRAPGSKRPSEVEKAALAELVEVERALAALEGRNVDNAEHLVVLRRDAEKRRAALEEVIARARAESAQKSRVLPYKIAGALVAVAVVAVCAVPASRKISAHLRARDDASANVRSAIAPFEGRFHAARTILGEDGFAVAASKGSASSSSAPR